MHSCVAPIQIEGVCNDEHKKDEQEEEKTNTDNNDPNTTFSNQINFTQLCV